MAMAAWKNNWLMWAAVVTISVFRPALSEQCSGILERKEICCDDTALGCFTKDPPFSDLPLPCCPEGDEVTYSLYTRATRETPSLIRRDDTTLPAEFSSERTTAFLVHGWMGSGDNDWIHEIKDALLNDQEVDYNVIAVSWKYGASYTRYPQSASNTRTVGAFTGLIMEKLVSVGGAQYSKLWCIGHSLGSHMCAHAGGATPEKIGRITGLDPAGPWFESAEDVTVGLNPESAMFVDVIHSDAKGSINTYGTVRPLGHMDFYPNGLGRQPGCSDRRRKRSTPQPDTHGFLGCSHGRSVEFFVESIAEDCFVSRHICNDIEDMPASCSPCDGSPCAVMGYGAAESGKHGIYYLETNPSGAAPHCLG